MLFSTSGVLCGESTFNGMLSDLCDFTYTPQGTEIELHVLVLQIPEGKVNQFYTLFGCVMRHKNVFRCAMGGLAMYFFLCFQTSGETIDFRTNESWYNMPLLLNSRDASKPLTNKSYYKKIKKVCDFLKIPSSHYVHFGREVGAKILELEELESKEIEGLGNWNIDVRSGVASLRNAPVPPVLNLVDVDGRDKRAEGTQGKNSKKANINTRLESDWRNTSPMPAGRIWHLLCYFP